MKAVSKIPHHFFLLCVHELFPHCEVVFIAPTPLSVGSPVTSWLTMYGRSEPMSGLSQAFRRICSFWLVLLRLKSQCDNFDHHPIGDRTCTSPWGYVGREGPSWAHSLAATGKVPAVWVVLSWNRHKLSCKWSRDTKWTAEPASAALPEILSPKTWLRMKFWLFLATTF